MEFRKLEKAEHGQTRPLWETVFSEDTPSFLDYYYDIKAGDNEIYVAEDNAREICSMVQLNPYMMQMGNEAFCSHYIIAVATREDCRKRGLMRELLHMSLREMHRRGEYFTFLVPAAEAIYRPFDFRFVYDQRQGTVTGRHDDFNRYSARPAKPEDCGAMADFAAEMLLAYQVYTKRDAAYYSVMLKEQESEQGGYMLVYEENQMVGFFGYAGGTNLQIREPLFRKGRQKAFLHAVYELTGDDKKEVKCYGIKGPAENVQCKPSIMFRMLHPEAVLGAIKTKRSVELQLEISDPIIDENNCCLHITGTAGSYIKVEKQERRSGGDVIPIADLTSLLFGYQNAIEISGQEGVSLSVETVKQLVGIESLSEIFLNEVV